MPPRAAAQHVSSPLVSEALVTRADHEGLRVRLVDGPEVAARSAIAPAAVAEGDRVLVLDGGDTRYVVGVTHTARAATVRAPSGATAAVEGDAIVLRDAAGHALLSYDAATARLTLEAPTGDLRLGAPNGSVVIDARDEVTLRAERLRATLADAVWVAGRWELRAERLAERLGHAVRDVDGLMLTRVERARTLVRDAFDLVAKRTRLTSRDDTVVDGKRVLLG